MSSPSFDVGSKLLELFKDHADLLKKMGGGDAASSDEKKGRALLRKIRLAKKPKKSYAAYTTAWNEIVEDLNQWCYEKHKDAVSCKTLEENFEEKHVVNLRLWDTAIQELRIAFMPSVLLALATGVLNEGPLATEESYRTHGWCRKIYKRMVAAKMVQLL